MQQTEISKFKSWLLSRADLTSSEAILAEARRSRLSSASPKGWRDGWILARRCFYGLFDDPGRARPGARSARFRIDLGARALAHTEHAQNAAGRRRRAREALLRRDGPVRHIDGGGDGNQGVEGRNRCLSRDPA